MKPQDLKCFNQVAIVIGEELASIELQKVIDSKIQIHPSNTLHNAFSWYNSPQDKEFWYSIENKNIPITLIHLFVPFGHLFNLEQHKLFQAWLDDNQCIEQYTTLYNKWVPMRYPSWDKKSIYRIKPIELVHSYIDWDQVNPKYNWMATDKNGNTYLFQKKPILQINGVCWTSNKKDGRFINAEIFTSFKSGTYPWDKSLVERPTK